MELNIQKFLRQDGTLDKLREPPYSLIVKEKDNLALLKYTQGVSDGFNPIVNECRGLILDKEDNWNVVCYPFNRFYNVGQPEAATLRGLLKVYEKCDGALVKVYNYRGEWYCASNSTIDARKTFIDGKYNFFELVEAALAIYDLNWETFTSNLDPSYTYMFELICPETRQVVDYGKARKLYYLGERNNETFEEGYVPTLPVDNVKQYLLTTMDEIKKAVEELGNNAEGFVVVDEEWNRNKVKSDRYFKLHFMLDNGKPDYLKLIFNDGKDEFLSYFPRFAEGFAEVEEKLADIEWYAELLRANTSTFWDYSRKDFAANIDVFKPFQPFVFRCYEDHSMTWKKYTEDWDIHAWERMIERVE